MDDPLPTGTVTFLFTDIEASTSLWEHHHEAMKLALARHDVLLRETIAAHNGRVVKSTGDGCHAVFASAADAVAAAVEAQRALLSGSSQTSEVSETSEVGQLLKIRVRAGLHSGEAEARDGDYFGPAVNRAARIMSIAHGGQILLSAATAELLAPLPPGVSLRDLGEQRLKGVSQPIRVFQVAAEGLPADFPPPPTPEVAPGNLPVQLTSFIGRERELAEVERLLGTTRLLTLTGPGGTGKTRLSLQAGAAVQSAFSNGTWLVELAPLADPALVPAAVVSALSLSPQPGLPLMAALVDYLRAKQALLILDNCEHLVEACARLAAELLPACPRLTILASSREGLGVPGETTYHVPTLELPDPAAKTAAEVCRYDAAGLFLQRARAAQPGFAVTDANAAAVAQIVRRLDGIPLAIELAAARVRLLTTEQIAARLDDRFRLLTGGSRTALPRQQTLRALIDWSYTLLSPEEAALFRRLGVFAGGWTLEAAEAVCGRSQTSEVFEASEVFDVLDLLAGLVNKSLVVVDDHGDRRRYRYLETIRQYARDKLFESGEGETARDRHFAWYAERLADLDFTGLDGMGRWFGALSEEEDTAVWELLDHEIDNIRAAVNWAGARVHDLPSLEAYVNAAARSSLLLIFGGQPLESDELIADVLDRSAGEGWAQEEPARLRQLRHVALLIDSRMRMSSGEFPKALEAAEAGLALARQDGNEDAIIMCLFQEVFIYSLARDPRLVGPATELRDRARRRGFRWIEAVVVQSLGSIAAVQGDQGRAQALLDEADSLAGQTYLVQTGPYFLFNRGMLAILQGHTDRGIADLRQSLAELSRQRAPLFAARVESELAHALRRNGRIDEALPLYRASIHRWVDLGRRPAVANQLESFAFMAIAKEEYDRAARLLGAAEALRVSGAAPMQPWEQAEYDRAVAELRERLPAGALEAEWTAGRRLDIDSAVALAASDLP